MEAIHGSKNGPHVRVIMGYIWKQEWAIHGSYIREPYTGAIHGSKNGLYVRAIMGHTWK